MEDRTCTVVGCESRRVYRLYCHKHYRRARLYGDPQAPNAKPGYARTDPVLRFWPKVDQSGDCWLWKRPGAFSVGGYGRFWDGDRFVPAHRFSFELVHGLVPDGLQLDHLCRNRACVNPAHLEPVTPKENNRRADLALGIRSGMTVCKRGHEMTPDNTYTSPSGGRQCRACRAVRDQRL